MKRVTFWLCLGLSFVAVQARQDDKNNHPNTKNGSTSITTVGDAVVRNAAGAMIRGTNIPKQPFKIYTNPNKELLIIEYASSDFKDGDIKVSDIKGRLIKQVNLEGNLTKISLNTSTWKNGAYTIVLSQYNTHQTVMQTIYLSR